MINQTISLSKYEESLRKAVELNSAEEMHAIYGFKSNYVIFTVNANDDRYSMNVKCIMPKNFDSDIIYRAYLYEKATFKNVAKSETKTDILGKWELEYEGKTYAMTVIPFDETSESTQNTSCQLSVDETMSQEEMLEWLSDFQQKLIKNDYDEVFQGQPIYYGIMDYDSYVTEAGYHDKIEIFNDGEPVSVSDFIAEDEDAFEELFENETITKTGENEYVINDSYEFKSFVEDVFERNTYVQFVAEYKHLVSGRMFLTRQAAEEHLAKNYYHYDPRAFVYAMTAWRSPEVKTLMKILMTIDISQLKNA